MVFHFIGCYSFYYLVHFLNIKNSKDHQNEIKGFVLFGQIEHLVIQEYLMHTKIKGDH